MLSVTFRLPLFPLTLGYIPLPLPFLYISFLPPPFLFPTPLSPSTFPAYLSIYLSLLLYFVFEKKRKEKKQLKGSADVVAILYRIPLTYFLLNSNIVTMTGKMVSLSHLNLLQHQYQLTSTVFKLTEV